MTRHRRERGTAVRLGIGAAIDAVALGAWFVESVRRQGTRQVARAALWPRPDGSVRSFGEVWEIPA